MFRWDRSKSCVLATALVLCLVGCHLRVYEYADSKHHVTISYPGQVTLLSDPAFLDETFTLAVSTQGETSKVSFAVQTDRFSSATCVVQDIPGQAQFTPETYFEATTARELALVRAEIVEPRSDIVINGKTFQQVGFSFNDGDGRTRSRIYEYYDPVSRRVLDFSLTMKPEDWDQDLPILEPIVRSLRLDW